MKKLIPFCFLFAFIGSACANAEQQQQQVELPFTGKRIYNLYGGNNNDQSIVIKSDGHTEITAITKVGSYTLYKGKYADRFPLEDGGYYKVVGDSMIELDSSGNIKYECKLTPDFGNPDFHVEPMPCVAKLYDDESF